MKFNPCSIIQVYFMRGSQKYLMGRLMLKHRKIFFEYGSDFIKLGLELSPFHLPLKPGPISSNTAAINANFNLFGVFNDSLPDGWNKLLLDRKLIKAGLAPDTLSPLDRLSFVGSHGMGALIYEPEQPQTLESPNQDLDTIANEIALFQADDDQFLDALLTLGGSSAGARPKALIKVGEEDWMIKFCSSIDPKDIGNIEYAYHLMAEAAGLEVPPARLFPSQKNKGYFGVKRFDRSGKNRIHMHTISGLLHADHREPSLDYEAIMKTTLWLTQDLEQCEKQFRAAVFNVASHNRDDHAKNFSFLMNEQGKWSVSPAYDLTFSSGPWGEHCSLVMGEGKNPGLPELLKLAALGNIKKSKAIEIIEQVKTATSKWGEFATQAEVSQASKKLIQKALDKIHHHL